MTVSVVGEEPTPSAWARTRPDVQGKVGKTPRQCRLNVRRWGREGTDAKTGACSRLRPRFPKVPRMCSPKAEPLRLSESVCCTTPDLVGG